MVGQEVDSSVPRSEQENKHRIPNYSTDGEQIVEEGDDEEMLGYVSSDDEHVQRVVNEDGELEDFGVEFNPKTDMAQQIHLTLGMKFANTQICKDALRELAIQGGWEFTWVKNDNVRVKAVCKSDNCPFLFFASMSADTDDIMVKELNLQHRCVRKFNNKMVNKRYLVTRFKDHIAMNPSQSTDNLASEMTKILRVSVSKAMAYKAKVAAIKEIEGSAREQYKRLADYAIELKRVDPDTTVEIKCDFNNPEKLSRFQRMYICLGALKNGFKSGCRSLVGLDGAHLKTCFGGQLLTAVGLDVNNTSWVVAYALVEMENKNAWIWVLRLLCNDLDIHNGGRGWVFISDKQKGLIPAVDEVVPSASKRFCARHLWINFTKKFGTSIDLRDAMWKIVKTTTIPHYDSAMEAMKELNEEASKWLMDPDRPPKHWCRAFFEGGYDTDMVVNNACESFNSWIAIARTKPPITMLEDIRVKLMTRIRLRKEKMETCVDQICPNIRVILERNKEKATQCTPTFNGAMSAEVDNISGTKNVVSVDRRTCTCKRWDLTGIPCKHAVSAIYGLRMEPDDFVSRVYTTETYMRTYNNLIQPCTSMDMWTKNVGATIQPPMYTRQPGRPKTKRIKDSSEKMVNGVGKLGRIRNSVKCGNCGEDGHNVRSCRSHLPSKKKATGSTKRKATKEPSQSKENSQKKRV